MITAAVNEGIIRFQKDLVDGIMIEVLLILAVFLHLLDDLVDSQGFIDILFQDKGRKGVDNF